MEIEIIFAFAWIEEGFSTRWAFPFAAGCHLPRHGMMAWLFLFALLCPCTALPALLRVLTSRALGAETSSTIQVAWVSQRVEKTYKTGGGWSGCFASTNGGCGLLGLMFPPLEILGGSAWWTQIFQFVFLEAAVSKSEIEVAGRPTSDEYSTSHGWTVTSNTFSGESSKDSKKCQVRLLNYPRFALATLTQCSGTTFRVWTMQEGGVRCTLAIWIVFFFPAQGSVGSLLQKKNDKTHTEYIYIYIYT